MKRLLLLAALAALLIPTVAFGQAGTPVTFGPWSKLNMASDVHSSDLGCYDPAQVSVAPRNLQITMVAQSTNCGQTGSQSGTFTTTQAYKSGSVVLTNQTFAPTAGNPVTIVGRMKMGRGWSAFWMLGTNCNPVARQSWDNVGPCSWSSDAASSAEFDISESQPGLGYPGYAQQSGHNKFVNNGSDACNQAVSDNTQNFHTYKAVWSTTSLDVSVDGVVGCHYTTGIPTHPMFIIIETRQNGNSGSIDSGFAAQPTTVVQYIQVCQSAVADCSVADSPVGTGNTIFYDNFSTYSPPAVDFTDLTSGPNTGGENNNGTILTIYGKNFGATRGTSTVTIGGQPVAAYLQWGGRSKAATAAAQLETISVAIGSAAVTGTVAVTTSNGASLCEDTKDSCQFTVRAGNIRCVSTTGNDANAGTFPSACWRTIPKADSTLAPGDIAYVLNGVNQTAIDNFNASVSIEGNSCTAPSPCALVVYPGALSTVGTVTTGFGMRTPATGGAKGNWVIAGFNINGVTGLDLVSVDGWRVINNDFNCPNGNGQAACMHTDTTTQYRFYGNYTHNVGDTAASIDKFYHANYFTTNTNHVWAGWNEINNNPSGVTTAGGCRAIQFFSTGGADQFDLHVHDNWIHNSICDGINFSTVNPDNGVVEAYNNVIYHVGTGPDPVNGSSDYACVVAGGGGTTPVQFYNNTMYDCGSRKAADSGVIFVGRAAAMWNNAVQQLTGEVYLTSSSAPASLSGSNNIWNGVAGTPSQTTGNITSAPGFTTPGSDFTLLTGSPAIGAGTSTHMPTWDFSALIRPVPPSIGAYEFTAGTAAATSPAVSLAPTSRAFGNQVTMTTSAAQTVTLTNTGTASLAITSIALTGTNAADFSISSNTCGATLGAGSNCIVGVTFTPSANGSRAASLTFTTNASTSPDNAALTGTGTQPDIYLAQAAAGAGNGFSCANARAVSYYNASGNWGTTPGQIGSGITVHLCANAPITSSLVSPASQGTGLITIKLELGASMQQAAAQNFIGIFNRTNSYLITGQAPCGFQSGVFVACTESIKNTANGSPSGFANTVTGIKMLDFSGTTGSVTVQNLEIGPGYVHNDPNDNTFSDGAHLAIAVFADSINQQGSISVLGSYVHDHSFSISINPRQASAAIPPTVTVANVEFFHNDHDIYMGAACSPACYFASYHHNHSHDHSNWDTPNNVYHHDGIHIAGTFDQAFETDIYNNLFDGPWEGNGTGPIFNQSAVQNLKAFNNIFVCTPANCTQDPSALWQYGGGPNQLLANNTLIQTGLPHGTGPNFTNNGGVLMTNPNGNSVNVSFLNNIVDSATNEVSFNSQVLAANTGTSGLDYNLYSNPITNGSRNFGWNGTLTDSFTTWQGLSGEGTHSRLVGNGLLATDGTPQTGSPAIGTGTNLTSLCVGALTPLCTDYFGNPRPSSGSWNIGAIGNPPTGGTPLAALSQTSAAFFNQMVGTTTSLPMVVTLSNNGTAVLTITSLTFTGTNPADFGQSNNCGAGIAAGTSCLITITFSPSALGPRSATLNVNDNASGSPHTVSLTGNGMKTISGAGTISGTGTVKVQ